MKKWKNIIIIALPLTVVLTLVLIYAFTPARKLRWVLKSDPTADAKAAVDKKDFQLRGIYGEGLFVPGLDETLYFKCAKDYGVYPIEGTSSKPFNKEHEKLISLATTYALKYNQAILNLAPKSSNKYDPKCLAVFHNPAKPVIPVKPAKAATRR